ncbi:Holliday junction branch migration protein RuvA [Acidiphilium iwatense]|uniref:Holliday junction branch migration complex subunit RuvA n=1 Tax=Acidiphilium iwatense TaxID=768198 RepID=A0ABS9DXT9_9PROT|nr:Holliday junction branch migration protein RuvA [Acidiphilium iwatense]MCF3946139.1 Holliday junction branch migration protein RuvA [Acidiphilium iwatense]
MIGRLTGVADSIEDGRCLIEVNGVGYVVFLSARSLAALPAPPARASVLVETQVREDAITLYGFIDQAERDWFRLLTTIQGVGSKVALALLSALPPDRLAAAIASGDRASVTRAPGVGPKLAARLIAELRERVLAMPVGAVSGLNAIPVAAAPSGATGDALSALINLGYRRGEAEQALAASIAALGAEAALDALIRDGLRRLAR